MNPQKTGKPSNVSFRKSTRRGKRWLRLQWLQTLSFQGEEDDRNKNGYVLPGAFPSSYPSSDLSVTARPWYPYRLRPFHQASDKARGFGSNATADAQLCVPSTRLSHQVNHLHVSPPPNYNVTVHSEVLRNTPSSGQPASAEQDSHPVVIVLTAGSHPVPTSPDEDSVFPPMYETVPVSTPADRDSIVPCAAIPSLTSSSASSLTAEPTFASRNTSAAPATLQCRQCEDSSAGKRHTQCKVATYCSVACQKVHWKTRRAKCDREWAGHAMKGTKKEMDSAKALDFLKRVEIATEAKKQELVNEQVVNFVVGCLCIDGPIKTIGQDRDRTDMQRDVTVRLAQLIKGALDALVALPKLNQMVENALDKDPKESL